MLDDSTTCLLSKIGEQTWELRVSRGPHLFRVAVFSELGVAMSTAQSWRAEFAPRVKIA